MKKILGLLFSLLFSITSFAQSTDADYAKTVKGEGIIRHSLAKTSKKVVHLFDALPKITTYQYTGTQYQFTRAQQVALRVFYPPYWSSSDEWELKVPVPTDTDKSSMTVSINDLGLMQVTYLRNLKRVEAENDAMMKKLGLPKVPIAYTDTKLQYLTNHKMLFDVAKAVNSDYIPAEKAGMRPVKFANIEDGFIKYSDYDGGYFTGIIQNRYVIVIELKSVSKLHNCTDVEHYLAKYMADLNFAPLTSAKQATVN